VKPGDVLRLKDDTLGLDDEDLYAIYLDRVKRGKNYLVVAHTRKGKQELSRDNVKDVALKARVDDPQSMSPNQLDSRLDQLINDLEDISAEDRQERRKDIDELDDRRLWELVVNDVDGEFTPEQAARIVFEAPTEEDVNEVRSVLQDCHRKGVGYFEQGEGRGETYTAYTVDEIKAARRDIEGLRKLRNQLVHVEEVEDPETGELETIITSIHPDDADLSEEDSKRLELAADQMVDFVLHDRDRGEVGLADTPIHTLDGFILNRFCRFLAYDWLSNQDTSISGAFVRFLLETDLLAVGEANDLVARRHVNLSEFFEYGYPDRAERTAERLPDGIPDEEHERREDLRHLETYTIDPADAGDYDDAISIVEDGDDTLLYVHIADVGHYVSRGSALDFEARSRGTSVYLPTDVLPMLPERLSENLCSLRADDPHLAMTAKLRIGPEGRVRDADFAETIVEVDENLAYEYANTAIKEGTEPFASLHELAQRMREQRIGLDLDTDELNVTIEHESVDPHLKSGTRATRLIEQFMVAANEAVARELTDADLPIEYRCHPLPERAEVETFNQRMQVMEEPLSLELPDLDDEDDEPDESDGEELMDALESGGSVELVSGGFVSDEEEEDADDEEDEIDTGPQMPGLATLDEDKREAWLEPFQQLLDDIDEITDDRKRELVHLQLLGCMGRAFYTPDNLGHFGLGSTCYAHFTSPIRRYPDLVTHRQLKYHLTDEDERDEDPPHTSEELVDLCPRNTDQGVEAEQLERDLIAVAMAFEALTEDEGTTHSGLVNGITKGGVFLTLDRGQEARLPTSDIPGGPWEVDNAQAKLFKGEVEDPEQLAEDVDASNWREMQDEETGEIVQVRLRLGDEMALQVASIDLARGQVAVKLAGQADEDDEDSEAPTR